MGEEESIVLEVLVELEEMGFASGWGCVVGIGVVSDAFETGQGLFSLVSYLPSLSFESPSTLPFESLLPTDFLSSLVCQIHVFLSTLLAIYVVKSPWRQRMTYCRNVSNIVCVCWTSRTQSRIAHWSRWFRTSQSCQSTVESAMIL
ncbi:unnamed protein product [Peronospora belbahrii]|uniref:Uncharacterized protein n=1 Tax=Peronospora belbahrii TaxID=622444 RepID=A0ABN8D736_9STRA|nr:unnamed protein product [Peronospora belbahrii]